MSAIYRQARVGGCLQVDVEQRNDGSTVIRSTEALAPYARTLNDCLQQWADAVPDRTFVAIRGTDGHWLRVSYAQMLVRVKAVGQALLLLGANQERPVMTLSDNDIEHLTMALAAAWAGVPYVPVSPAYSLVSQDYAKLRHIVGMTTPGIVFAASTAFERAISAIIATDVQLVLTKGALADRPSTLFSQLLATTPGPELAAAHAAVGPDTVIKILFTSGSTKAPKGVINTHRMICANLQMQRQCMAFLADDPPVLIDWLPWTHTFGGNQNVGICLYNGGTLYIDEGKPTPKGIAQTIANLREIAPTVYFNVPKGFEELSLAMEHDDVLRRNLFSRVKAFMFAGAGLSQAVWDRLDRQGEATVGERIRIITGLGMTETAPSCLFLVQPGAGAGHIGLPCPGVDAKLVPLDGKTEIRFRGPNVMPGYWRAPEQTQAAFDDEGFYCTGDAVKWIDAADPQRGLLFDGRIAEDFKLSTGTFVNVGPLRAKVIAAGDPLVQDVVVTGINQDDIGLLVFPRLDDLRRHFALSEQLSVDQLLASAPVRAFFQDMLNRLWAAGTGSANRPARALLLSEPAQLDRGEITDKGSINQRAVLTHRAALVARLYEGTQQGTQPDVLIPTRG